MPPKRLLKLFSLKKNKHKNNDVKKHPEPTEAPKKQKKRLNLFRKITKKRLMWLVGLIILTASFSSGFLYITYHFKIRNIDIGESNPNYLSGLSSIYNQNILFITPEAIAQNLKDANPYIKKIYVKKVFPDTLFIRTDLYRPVAFFEVNNGYYVVSEDGKILEKTKQVDQDLPIIHYYQKFPYNAQLTGDIVNYKDVLMAIHFTEKTLDLGLKISSIDINGLNMIALYAKEAQIIFTTEKDQELQEYQLATLLTYLKKQEKIFTLIDLRFDKPIIKFKN